MEPAQKINITHYLDGEFLVENKVQSPRHQVEDQEKLLDGESALELDITSTRKPAAIHLKFNAALSDLVLLPSEAKQIAQSLLDSANAVAQEDE
jgi:hypothetical protein